MNKIQQLIQQYCPNGVEFKELKEIAEIGTGSSNGNESTEDGQYPLFVRSKFIKKIDSFEFDEEAIIIPGEGGIGDIFHYINGKYALHQRAYRIHLLINYVTTKFIYYYMIANFKEFILQKAVNATVSSIRKPMIEKFQIPIPPLPIQQEIVKILDSFTQLEAELEAELEARRKQYEYYRNKLLSATEVSGKWLMNGVEVEWKTLREVCKFSNGKGHEQSIVEHGKYVVVNSKFVSTEGKVKKFSNTQISPIYKEDVLMVMSDLPNGKALAKCFIVDEDDKYTLNQRICSLTVKNKRLLCAKFLFYVSNRNQQLLRYDNGADQTNLRKDDILKVTIPIPPIEEQNRIVEVLDKFDSLVNDISIGLPAEIDGRRKQYNYYRGKLLTFKQS